LGLPKHSCRLPKRLHLLAISVPHVTRLKIYIKMLFVFAPK
jgi:hypothetical protein